MWLNNPGPSLPTRLEGPRLGELLSKLGSPVQSQAAFGGRFFEIQKKQHFARLSFKEHVRSCPPSAATFPVFVSFFYISVELFLCWIFRVFTMLFLLTEDVNTMQYLSVLMQGNHIQPGSLFIYVLEK